MLTIEEFNNLKEGDLLMCVSCGAEYGINCIPGDLYKYIRTIERSEGNYNTWLRLIHEKTGLNCVWKVKDFELDDKKIKFNI